MGRTPLSARSMGSKDHRWNSAGAKLWRIFISIGTPRPCNGSTFKRGACKGPADFDCQHGDLLYIYSAGSGETLQAIYFDYEGHVIQYGVSTPKPTMAVFLSDPTQPGAQFRLSYELAEGVMTGKFQMKMPGQAEFMSYLEWSGKPQ